MQPIREVVQWMDIPSDEFTAHLHRKSGEFAGASCEDRKFIEREDDGADLDAALTGIAREWLAQRGIAYTD